MLLFLGVCSLLLLLVTILPYARHPHWIIRGMDFPRLQIAIFASILVVAQVLLLDFRSVPAWGLIAVTVLCLACQLWWVLPYTRVWPKEVKASVKGPTERQLSILTSNVLMPNRNADALIALVREHQPDVLVVLESNQWWEDRLAVLEDAMPFSIKCPLDNLYGMHVFSKLPLHESETSYLVEEGVPSMHTLIELRSGERIRAHFLHPAPPSPTENPESAERDAELVIVARSVAACDQPVIVTGDLNDVAWSATTRLFRKISGLLDPRVGRGMFNTFHVSYPMLRWPLDHLFHSRHFTIDSILRMPSIGSDHFSLLTRLAFAPQRGTGQEGLEADDEERAWASEITREQDVSKDDVPRPGQTTKLST